MPRPTFSFILCTLGRTAELKEFLQALASQCEVEVETLIVDQNKDDRLREVVDEYGEKLSIRWIRSEPGLSHARNVALPLATGELIAFPDDDCLYPEGFIQNVVNYFRDHPASDGLSVPSRDPTGALNGPRWQRGSDWIEKETVFRQAISFGIFLRRRVVEKVGLFDEVLGTGSGTPWQSGEETDYVLRALAHDFRIWFEPALHCVHPTPVVDERFAGKQAGYSRGTGRVIALHGYSAWFRLRILAGPIVRCLLSMRGDRVGVKMYWAIAKGRLEGMRSLAPARRLPNTVLSANEPTA